LKIRYSMSGWQEPKILRYINVIRDIFQATATRSPGLFPYTEHVFVITTRDIYFHKIVSGKR